MNRTAVTIIAAGAIVAGALGFAPSGHAAPGEPPSLAQTVSSLQMHGYTVIVSNVGMAAFDQCTTYSIRPGHAYSRMDSGFPGAGDDLITKVVSMTVFVDADC